MAQIFAIILLLLLLFLFSREYFFFIKIIKKKKHTMFSMFLGYSAFFLLPILLSPIASFAPSNAFRMLSLGILDVQVFIYFFALTAMFWFFRINSRYSSLMKRTTCWAPNTTCIIVVSLYVASGAFWQPYIDLTPDQMHTIRPYTKEILNQLDSECRITWYRSDSVSEKQQFRTTAHVLTAYARENPRYCKLVVRDPGKQNSPELPETLGLLPMDSGSYSGILIEYRGRYRLLPSTLDYYLLEYELTKILENLVLYRGSNHKPVQMLVLGNPNVYDYLPIVLEHAGFTLIPPENPERVLNPKVPLIIVGSTYCTAATAMAIQVFIEEGGAAVFFVSGTSIDTMKTWSVEPKSDDPIHTVLKKNGVSIMPNLLLDEQNYRIVMPALDGNGAQSVSYPYWITVNKSGFQRNHVIFSGISSLLFYWPSPVVYDRSKLNFPFIQTSKRTHLVYPPFFTHPLTDQDNFVISTKERYPIGAFLETSNRVLVIADEYCISSLIDLSANYDNLLFFINCIEWISENEKLTSLKRSPDTVLSYFQD